MKWELLLDRLLAPLHFLIVDYLELHVDTLNDDLVFLPNNLRYFSLLRFIAARDHLNLLQMLVQGSLLTKSPWTMFHLLRGTCFGVYANPLATFYNKEGPVNYWLLNIILEPLLIICILFVEVFIIIIFENAEVWRRGGYLDRTP